MEATHMPSFYDQRAGQAVPPESQPIRSRDLAAIRLEAGGGDIHLHARRKHPRREPGVHRHRRCGVARRAERPAAIFSFIKYSPLTIFNSFKNSSASKNSSSHAEISS